jgi:hypothetical protein
MAGEDVRAARFREIRQLLPPVRPSTRRISDSGVPSNWPMTVMRIGKLRARMRRAILPHDACPLRLRDLADHSDVERRAEIRASHPAREVVDRVRLHDVGIAAHRRIRADEQRP